MKTVVLFAAASAALIAADEPRSKWNLRDHIPLSEVVVQSHRGAGVLSAENSVEAFEIAWKLNTIPEADLRTTKDGVIVAFHDNNFKRILPNATPEMQKRGVADLTWEETRALDIGAWKGPEHKGQRVPRMSELYEILRKHPQRRMYIDIKNVDLKQLADEAHAAGVANRFILASTDYKIIRRWKELAPESSTLHWMGGTEAQLAKRIEDLRATNFASITQLQIHVRLQDSPEGKVFMPSPKFLMETGDELRRHKIVFQVLAWDSNDPKVIRRLMDLGAASFATDYPDVIMRTIREYYAEKR